MKLGKMLVLSTCMLVTTCGAEDDREETVSKLRSLGVVVSPVAVTPTANPQPIEFTFVAALPVGQEAAAQGFADSKSKDPMTVSMTVGSETYTDHNGFRIFTVRGTYLVAASEALPSIPENPGYKTFQYGLKLTSGSEQENMIGNFLIHHPSSTMLAWAPQTVVILDPQAGSVIKAKETNLVARIDGQNSESYRVGWFSSGGKIKNRRALATKVTEILPGKHTFVVTARGLKSGSFAYAVIDVTAE